MNHPSSPFKLGRQLRQNWPALLVLLVATLAGPANAQTQIQIYGMYHCSTDACSWAAAPDLTTFDVQNHWIIDRGDGIPSVNLVVLSFVNPVKLMDLTTDSTNTRGIPIGMTSAIVNYFQSKGVRVMMSIGGFSFTKDWDKALSTNPTQLGINAANAARQFNVGMEIDYERSSNPNLTGLEQFVTAYRSVLPYDATGNNFAARLTIDLGNGDTFLTALDSFATANWLNPANPVLDYANALVASQKTSLAALETGWQQHVAGTGSVTPLAPAKLTASLWLVGNSPIANCTDFAASEQNAGANFVETVPPKGEGTTSGMLGYMFWGGGCQGNGTVCTFPPNTCQGGLGVGARTLNVPIPMPALRQQ